MMRTVDPASFIQPRLRVTFRLIERLTRNRYRCCFASLEYLQAVRGKAEVTARRHINQLVELGIIRKVYIPGGVNNLFICPLEEWKVIPQSEQDCALMSYKLHTMPYNEYLKTDHWKEVRSEALHTAEYKCQLCNTSNALQVHHRTYERRGYEDIKDLTVLCRHCHAKHHDKREDLPDGYEG